MNTNYTFVNYDDDIKDKLNRNSELLKNKLSQVDDLKYEIDLIEESSVNITKQISDYIQRVDWHSFWLNFDHKKHTFSPTAKEFETRFKYIEMDYLFVNGKPDGIKLKDIILCGYCEKFWLAYTKEGKEFVIVIPCFKNANKNNYKNLAYEILTTPDECRYETILSTLSLSELGDGVTKFLNGEI